VPCAPPSADFVAVRLASQSIEIAGSAWVLDLLAARSVRRSASICEASRSGRGCELDAVTAGDLFANRRHRLTAVFGRGPRVCHQRLECPEPQVVGAPPADFVEQPEAPRVRWRLRSLR